MTIYIVVGGGCGFGRRGLPELARPAGKGIGEAFSGTSTGKPGEETLDVAIAIGPDATGEEGQGITAVAAQIPGSAQADHGEKKQGEEEGLQAALGQAPKACGRWGDGERLLEGGEEAALVGGSQEQEAPGTLLPDRGFVGDRN